MANDDYPEIPEWPSEHPEPTEPGIFERVIWENVRSFFVSMFEAVWANFASFWGNILKQTTNEVFEVFGKAEASQWKAMLDSFVSMGYLDRKAADNLYKLKDLATPLDLLAYFSMYFTLHKSAISLGTEGAENLQRQVFNKDLRPNLPYYRDIMLAAFIAPEKTGEVREIMAKAGFPDEVIDLMFLSNYRLYDENMIRDLFLRGVLGNEEMFMRMRELGYTDTRIKEIAQSWEVIPGAQDLFTMVAKEAFEPEFIEKIGLADEFPEEQVQWLQKQGISREWALKYWYAHWDQPSIQAGYEMLHRGVITLDELDLLFRAVEIPPFWRDKLTKIAYNPYTRVDVRRMHDQGVIDDEGLMRAYMDLGYDEEKALGMTNFTIRYNRQNDRELTRSQILSAYIDSLMTREDAKELLINLEFSEDHAEFLIIYEEVKRDQDYQKQAIKNIGDRFTNNLLDEYEVRNRLGKMNLQGEQIELLIDRWKIDLYEDRKVPSKSDLEKFLKAGVISLDEYRIEMGRLGYGFQYINWFEQIATGKKR